jgi:hypothetical protein
MVVPQALAGAGMENSVPTLGDQLFQAIVWKR